MVVTDRPAVARSADELERLAELDTAKPTRPLIIEGRVLLAALSIAAGAIHLAMVPSHANQWQAEGVAFAVAGWLQIGFGGLLFSNRWRTALRVSCLVNVAFIAAWAVTRIWGAPWGPHSGVSESAGFVDITCVVLEGALVVAGAVLLAWRPRGGYRLRNDTRAMFSVVPSGILAECLEPRARSLRCRRRSGRRAHPRWRRLRGRRPRPWRPLQRRRQGLVGGDERSG